MEPLNSYEIQELMATLTQGSFPIPIGSLWSSHDTSKMLMVLHHANRLTDYGTEYNLVLQSLPDGVTWIIPTEEFMNGGWQNIGFVWDRSVHV